MSVESLWRIEAPHYVAGLVVIDDRVTEAASILRWTIGKSWPWFKKYLRSKGFHGAPVTSRSVASPPPSSL